VSEFDDEAADDDADGPLPFPLPDD